MTLKEWASEICLVSEGVRAWVTEWKQDRLWEHEWASKWEQIEEISE